MSKLQTAPVPGVPNTPTRPGLSALGRTTALATLGNALTYFVKRKRDINGGSLEIGPFTTAGLYHIYCSVHVGMNLTIVVQ